MTPVNPVWSPLRAGALVAAQTLVLRAVPAAWDGLAGSPWSALATAKGKSVGGEGKTRGCALFERLPP
jgi:hypothetical protein